MRPLGEWIRRRRPRDWILLVVVLLFTLALAYHRSLPAFGGLTSLAETFLPWSLVAIALLAVIVTWLESPTAGLFLVLPAVIWGLMFGPTFEDRSRPVPAGATPLIVVSENVDQSNPDAASTAADLVKTKADVIALEALPSGGRATFGQVFLKDYRYSTADGGLALWSRYPLGSSQTVGLGDNSTDRALVTSILTPNGVVTIYVVELAAVGIGRSSLRNGALEDLRATMLADSSPRLVVAGDFETSATDREMRRLTEVAPDTQQAAGRGFGFTWPSQVPMTRPDHILVRGLATASSYVLPGNGSDHRGIAAVLYS
jgi:vancomycin resistance protein VanJ